MPMHDGHRQRLKDRFRREGLEHFEEHQVLELLLFYCIPRRDTNPIAHTLIERFGSLANVLEAPIEELAKVPGMGDNTAMFLSLTMALSRYYKENREKKWEALTSIKECCDKLVPLFHGRRNETVYLLCLDAKCKYLCCREISEGGTNSAGISVRKIVEVALGVGASSVVLAHNHPSGIAVPSREDVVTTRRVAAALDAVEIELVDHIVVADEDYVSLVQSGLYRPGECRMEV